jgi:hypothetical protein
LVGTALIVILGWWYWDYSRKRKEAAAEASWEVGSKVDGVAKMLREQEDGKTSQDTVR